MEGDGQIRRGGEELEGAAPADVAAQDASGQLLAIGDGYHVAVADVQPGHQEIQSKAIYKYNIYKRCCVFNSNNSWNSMCKKSLCLAEKTQVE